MSTLAAPLDGLFHVGCIFAKRRPEKKSFPNCWKWGPLAGFTLWMDTIPFAPVGMDEDQTNTGRNQLMNKIAFAAVGMDEAL